MSTSISRSIFPDPDEFHASIRSWDHEPSPEAKRTLVLYQQWVLRRWREQQRREGQEDAETGAD
jgi:hypothetical protein